MANPNSHIHQQRFTKWIVFSFSCPGIWRIAQLYKQFVKKRFLRSGKSPTIHCMSGFQRGLCFPFLSWIWRCLGQSRWSSIGSVNGNHVNSCQAIFGTSSISGSRKEMFSFFCSGIWRIASFIQYFSGVHDLALRGKSRAHQRKGEPSNEFLQALDPSLAHNLPAVPESDCFFTLVPRWRIASFIQTICQEPSAIQANRRLLTGGVKGNHRYIFSGKWQISHHPSAVSERDFVFLLFRICRILGKCADYRPAV